MDRVRVAAIIFVQGSPDDDQERAQVKAQAGEPALTANGRAGDGTIGSGLSNQVGLSVPDIGLGNGS
jgi:hypothetical protein